jgi:hypothetical protein
LKFKQGLLQLRNELVNHMDRKQLPELKNEDRYCSKCPLLTTCSLLNEMEIKKNQQCQQTPIELYSNSIRHLNDEHRKYFFKWYKMLEFEFGDYKQFDAGNFIWSISQAHLESTGFSVFDLRLNLAKHSSNASPENGEYSGERFYLLEFVKDHNKVLNII